MVDIVRQISFGCCRQITLKGEDFPCDITLSNKKSEHVEIVAHLKTADRFLARFDKKWQQDLPIHIPFGNFNVLTALIFAQFNFQYWPLGMANRYSCIKFGRISLDAFLLSLLFFVLCAILCNLAWQTLVRTRLDMID